MKKRSTPRRVAVVGGGAGGLCAALAAAQEGAEVVLLEQANRVGKKLLKTGNGRCNLSNTHVSPEYYNRPKFVSPLLRAMPCGTLREFFGTLGLWTVADEEGRIYPRSDTAASVLDVLRLGCEKLGAAERCSTEIASVRPAPHGFVLTARTGETFAADRVIVATGGGTSLLRSLGHKMVPFSPVLCPLKTDTDAVRGLAGLRCRCCASLLRGGERVYAENGEILFRDFGVSGIVALNLSRHALPGDTLSLDLLPELSPEELAEKLQAQSALRESGELFTGIFHRRLGEAVSRRAGSGDPARLAQIIKNYRFTVLGPGDTQHAQVTRGGADVSAFDPETLESRLVPGLYAVGEALDIDGACGGYNLHWAFASGLRAGRSAGHD